MQFTVSEMIAVVVGIFVIAGVVFGLAKWIVYLTVKPIWKAKDGIDGQVKELFDRVNALENSAGVDRLQTRNMVTEAMSDMVQQVADLSGRYYQFHEEHEKAVAELRLTLSNNYVNNDKLERELKICRTTTHCGA
jgi:hypothetical protein